MKGDQVGQLSGILLVVYLVLLFFVQLIILWFENWSKYLSSQHLWKHNVTMAALEMRPFKKQPFKGYRKEFSSNL